MKLSLKLTIAFLLLVTILFSFACYNSIVQTENLCKLTLGI